MSWEDLRLMHPEIAEAATRNRLPQPREMRRMLRYMAKRYGVPLAWYVRVWWWLLDLVGR